MALQDPNAAPAPWEWPTEFQVDPAAWGIPMSPMPAPPPGTTDLQLGGTAGVIENAAAPALAAPPVSQAEVVPPADPFNVLTPIDRTMADLAAGAVQAPPPQPPIAVPSPLGAIDTGVAKVGPAAADARAENDVEGASAMLAMDPARLQRAELDLETERLDRQREMLEQERVNDAMEADRIAKQHVDAVAKAQAETARISNEAMAIANTKIVRDRRSGGRRLLDVIMGAVGGLVAGQTGGANQGLAIVLKRIDDDVEDQKAELQQRSAMLGVRRNIVGDELARSGDMYKAQELARLAAHDTAIADITTESMKFAPNGTRALQLAKFKYGLMQSRAAAVQALQERELKRVGDQAKTEHQLLENQQLRQKIAGAGVGVTPATNYGPKEFSSVTPPPGFKGTQSAWLEMRNKYQTGLKTEQEVADGGRKGAEEREQQLTRTGMGLFDYDANGKKVELVPNGSPDEVKALRNRIVGTKKIVALLDQAMALRTGWTSDLVGNDENKRLGVLLGQAKVAAKKAEDLGAITASDVELIKGIIGTDDFTSWRGVTAAVDQARRGLIQSARIEMNGQGMSARGAAEWDIPNQYEGQAKVSQEEAAYQALLGGKLEGPDKVNTLNAIAGAAQSADPTVNKPARARLRKLAEDAPDEVDRRSIKTWLTLPQFGGGQQ